MDGLAVSRFRILCLCLLSSTLIVPAWSAETPTKTNLAGLTNLMAKVSESEARIVRLDTEMKVVINANTAASKNQAHADMVRMRLQREGSFGRSPGRASPGGQPGQSGTAPEQGDAANLGSQSGLNDRKDEAGGNRMDPRTAKAHQKRLAKDRSTLMKRQKDLMSIEERMKKQLTDGNTSAKFQERNEREVQEVRSFLQGLNTRLTAIEEQVGISYSSDSEKAESKT